MFKKRENMLRAFFCLLSGNAKCVLILLGIFVFNNCYGYGQYDQIIDKYKNLNHKELLFELSKKRELDEIERYIYAKLLYKKNELNNSLSEMDHLESVGWLSDRIKIKKIKILVKEGRLEEGINEINEAFNKGLPKRYVKQISEIILEHYQDFPLKVYLSKSIQKGLKLFPYLKNNVRLLEFYLDLQLGLKKTALQATLVDYWAVADQRRYSRWIKKNKNQVKFSLKKYRNLTSDKILQHYLKQYSYRNYNYLIKSIGKKFPLNYLNRLQKRKYGKAIFETLLTKRRYSRIERLIKTGYAQNKFKFSRTEALEYKFKIHLRRGHVKSADFIISRLAQIKGSQKLVQLKYLDIANRYFYRGKYNKAKKYYQKINNNYLNSRAIESYKWNQLYIAYIKNNFSEIKKITDWKDSHKFKNKPMAAKFCYWTAKLDPGLTADNREKAYANCAVEYPLTYYGFRASQQTKSLQQREKGYLFKNLIRSKPLVINKEETEKLLWIDTLYSIGDEEFANDLALNEPLTNSNEDFIISLLEVLKKHHQYYIAQKSIFRKYYLEIEKRELSELVFWENLYPRAYKEAVNENHLKFKVPKNLVYSIIREESHFRKNAVSRVGAIGLMQLMPATAKFMGRLVKVPVKLDRLVEPDLNIVLGAGYLKRLLKRFNGNLVYSIAAYNGGPGNVKKWLRRYKPVDNDHFVETIPFNETKRYVQKVLKSYAIYSILYDNG